MARMTSPPAALEATLVHLGRGACGKNVHSPGTDDLTALEAYLKGLRSASRVLSGATAATNATGTRPSARTRASACILARPRGGTAAAKGSRNTKDTRRPRQNDEDPTCTHRLGKQRQNQKSKSDESDTSRCASSHRSMAMAQPHGRPDEGQYRRLVGDLECLAWILGT